MPNLGGEAGLNATLTIAWDKPGDSGSPVRMESHRFHVCVLHVLTSFEIRVLTAMKITGIDATQLTLVETKLIVYILSRVYIHSVGLLVYQL